MAESAAVTRRGGRALELVSILRDKLGVDELDAVERRRLRRLGLDRPLPLDLEVARDVREDAAGGALVVVSAAFLLARVSLGVVLLGLCLRHGAEDGEALTTAPRGFRRGDR